MSWFLDSSALVKLYSFEDGSEAVSELVRSGDAIVVSSLARAEVPAAVWRKHRSGSLDVHDVRALLGSFEVDWYGSASEEPLVIPVESRGAVLVSAAAVAGIHGLRSLDVVQLASALAARSVVSDVDSFLAYDRELSDAAATEGFAVSLPG